MDARALDRYLTSGPPEPVVDPHAPWELTFLTRLGDVCGPHPSAEELARGGNWGIEHGGDVDGETTFVIGTRAQAETAAERCNARHAYNRARHRTEPNGRCSLCHDFHEEEDWMKEDWS